MNSKQCKPTSSKLIIMLFVLLPTLASAQTLDEYVNEGLRNNLILQQKNLSKEQAEQSLRIARSFFLPSVNLLTDYTSGKGGRSIEIPVGDLLNPVYATLNQMTQSDEFPQIKNESQDFFPHDFYDAKIRTSIPIVNTDLYYNRNIHGQQVMMRQYEVDAYRRQLVMDIKVAYYNLLSAKAVIGIYESAVTLLKKNVEVNESLLSNGKGLPATVIRSKSELERVKAELNSARNQELNAKKYFNFLLNKKPDDEVFIDPSSNEYPLVAETNTSPSASREEIKILKAIQDINKYTSRTRQLNRLPKIHGFVDIGTQASGWQVNSDSKYYLLGVQLSLPLFQGFRNNISIAQTELEIEKTEMQLVHTSRQLELATEIARNDLNTAHQNYEAAEEQLKSARTYFNLIDRGYREGVNALIEFLDARNQLTSSLLQQNLRRFELLIAQAKLERETASYDFKN